MDAEQRTELLKRYMDGHRVVLDALEGITTAELDRRPAPDEWTAREIVHHLADSEMTSAIRLRKLLAEDNPVIEGYDEAEFARRFTFDRPLEASLDALAATRATSAEIVERIGEADWRRTGRHSESGPYGVETWLEIYANHAHDHADQIRRARGAVETS
ncbi:MAG: DinB family protein [Actinomycetota bacterium]